MLGALQKVTNVGNVTNPGKAENGTDYQYISGKFDFKRVEIDMILS